MAMAIHDKIIDNSYRCLVGIDLGTTFTCLSTWNGDSPVVCQSRTGKNVTPSVVFFDGKQKQELVGDVAVTFSRMDPDNGVYCIKREMGNRSYRVRIGGRKYTPVDLSALILRRVTDDLREKYPPDAHFDIEGAVVTVPYHFNSNQRADTEFAVKKAGLNLLGVINEPTAAALAYGLHLLPGSNGGETLSHQPETVLIFDAGGGTFDVTIIRLVHTEEKLLVEVLATGGDSRLGGSDFDDALMEEVLRRSEVNLDDVDPKTRSLAKRYLAEAVINCKESLSHIDCDFVAAPNIIPGKTINVTLTRSELEDIIGPWTERINAIMCDTMNQAGLKRGEISRIVKVGGSSKIPAMSRIIEEVTGQLPYGTLEPDLAVALGAAVYAAILNGRIVHKTIEIVDVISHSLGIETEGGRFRPIISRNSKVPCEATSIFGTTSDNETALNVNVFQGSADTVNKNVLIGKVHVNGLLPRPAGDLNIFITFRASSEQRISVVVEQKESGLHIVENLQRA
jgi:molecular chaperone DnaK